VQLLDGDRPFRTLGPGGTPRTKRQACRKTPPNCGKAFYPASTNLGPVREGQNCGTELQTHTSAISDARAVKCLQRRDRPALTGKVLARGKGKRVTEGWGGACSFAAGKKRRGEGGCIRLLGLYQKQLINGDDGGLANVSERGQVESLPWDGKKMDKTRANRSLNRIRNGSTSICERGKWLANGGSSRYGFLLPEEENSRRGKLGPESGSKPESGKEKYKTTSPGEGGPRRGRSRRKGKTAKGVAKIRRSSQKRPRTESGFKNVKLVIGGAGKPWEGTGSWSVQKRTYRTGRLPQKVSAVGCQAVLVQNEKGGKGHAALLIRTGQGWRLTWISTAIKGERGVENTKPRATKEAE